MLDYPEGQHDGRTGERRQRRYVCFRHSRVEHAQVVGGLGYDSQQVINRDAHAETRYPGTGLSRTLYLVLLASHVILSVPVVPLCLAAFYYALRKRFDTHKRITRFLFPVWLYVSVTGVIVFFLLRSAY